MTKLVSIHPVDNVGLLENLLTGTIESVQNTYKTAVFRHSTHIKKLSCRFIS